MGYPYDTANVGLTWSPHGLDRHGVAHMGRWWVAAGLNHYGSAHRVHSGFHMGIPFSPLLRACRSCLLHDLWALYGLRSVITLDHEYGIYCHRKDSCRRAHCTAVCRMSVDLLWLIYRSA
jgi:hypothetical protein